MDNQKQNTQKKLSSGKKTVVVGLSGGVDSSVTALLLKEQGYHVIGLFMKNWEESKDETSCTSAQDWNDVASVCSQIDIPYFAVNFVKEYQNEVFTNFLEELKKGLTPNPDILCNQKIKFKSFFEKALSLGADYVATGHYCRTKEAQLYKGLDANKDQSYFLSQINPRVLSKVLFPLGELKKSQVREIAHKNNLLVAKKKDSTGICFIGKRKFSKFVAEYLQAKPGDFKSLDGKKIGTHQGAHFYTEGQRRQLGLGGPGKRWYVVGKDINKNEVYVTQGDSHPALYAQELTASEPTWLVENKFKFPFSCKAKIRYRQSDEACTIHLQADKKVTVKFARPQRAISCGQSIAFYQEDLCLGGAKILASGPSLYTQGCA